MLQLMRPLSAETDTFGVPLPYGLGSVTTRYLGQVRSCEQIYQSRFTPIQPGQTAMDSWYRALRKDDGNFHLAFDLRDDRQIRVQMSHMMIKELFGDGHILGIAASLADGLPDNPGPIALRTVDGGVEYLARMVLASHTLPPYLIALVEVVRHDLRWTIDVFTESGGAKASVDEKVAFICESLLSNIAVPV